MQIKNRNVVIEFRGNPVVMGRNREIVLMDESGRERAHHRVPYGAKLLVDDGATVEKGDQAGRMGSLHHLPIITEKKGEVVLRRPRRRRLHARKWTRPPASPTVVVIDWKRSPAGNELKPRITLRDDDGEVIKLANGLEARYFMSVDAILSVENGIPREGRRRARAIPRETSKTRDITGGLPRVAELFEARKPKDYAIISESPGSRRVRQGLQDQAPDRRGTPETKTAEPTEYLIPKGKHISVQEGDYVEAATC